MDLDSRNISSPGLVKLRRYERWRPDNKTHLRSRFCCDSFFSWILLRSCYHCVRAHGRTEMIWLILNKFNEWFHSSRVKFPLGKLSASWFLVSMYLSWIFRIQINPSNNQSRVTLRVLETCLIMGLLFNDHVDDYFIVFEHIQQSFLTRRSGRLSEHYQYSWGRCSFYEIFYIFQYQQVVPFCLKSESRFQKQKQLDSRTPEQRIRLISIQYPKKSSQILLNCVRLQFDSCTTKMYDVQKRTMFFQKWISNLQDLLRIQSPWQSALFCSITHMTIFFVFTRVMNIWNQSIQAFVTSFGPFCYGSCELIYWP